MFRKLILALSSGKKVGVSDNRLTRSRAIHQIRYTLFCLKTKAEPLSESYSYCKTEIFTLMYHDEEHTEINQMRRVGGL
jgi:hypothetical protein